MAFSENCVLCKKSLDEGETFTIKEKAIQALIKASYTRKDHLHEHLLGKDILVIHVNCNRDYISLQSDINTGKSSAFAPTTRAQTSKIFDFKNRCIFCGEDASEKFVQSQSKKKVFAKRQTVSVIKDGAVREDLLQQAAKRSDQWGNEVMDRILLTEDLILSNARYHSFCRIRFMRSSSKSTEQESEEEAPSIASLIKKYIQEHPGEDSFALNKITENFKGTVANNQWLKQQIYERLGKDIIITSQRNVEPVIYLRDAGNKFLIQQHKENEHDESERRRIINAAAKIIAEDIRSQDYDIDNYPSPHSFLDNAEKDIPNSLKTFLGTVFGIAKRQNADKYSSKIVSIAHAIISCVRPRSFLSCIQIGLGSMLNKKFGSKSLLNILSALGFCCSYDDSLLFEASILFKPTSSTIASDAFSQFVFDNADHNINTIDGLRTFHAMGGIECVTPASAVSSGSSIPKLKKIPSTDTVGTFGAIPLKTFHGYKKAGLGNIVVQDLNKLNTTVRYEFDISSTDFLWLYNYKVQHTDVRGWNGFLETLTKNSQYMISRVVCLPFVNNPPGCYDTIYTVLNVAVEKIKSKNQNTAFVTFDQPLYMKAMEIIHCSDNPDLKKVIVRLGGFHLLITFLGSIGNIMDGSGLKELFSVIYAPASVDKMLAGHAYSGAIRAHILSHCALSQIILSSSEFSEEDILKLNELLEKTDTVLESIDTDPQFKSIKEKFVEAVGRLSQNSGTAKLWGQYFHMVSLVKMFIEAERSGNWQLHIETVQRMLPFFHSSGHYLYAKSAHLYLQEMYNLPAKMDEAEYRNFVGGCFTIRRTQKFWSGIWSDMTIEQVLMRSMKDMGGPTRGRGMSDSVLAKWALTTPALVDLTESVTQFCNVHLSSTEQHVDSRATRILRDKADVEKLIIWFDGHNPFPQTEGLISLSTGLKGDGKINCHEALNIGLHCLENTWKADGDESCVKTFKDIKYKKANEVTTLKSLVSSVEFADTTVTIDPSLLFQRICVLQKSDEELKAYFNYELAPYPLSLFDDNGMRKGQKSELYSFFEPVEPTCMKDPNIIYVIDGDFLLHKVAWGVEELFSEILDRYVKYLTNNYAPKCIVVFDGYPETANTLFTKSGERQRRMRISSVPEVKCDVNMPSTLTQEKFLSNEKNKSHFIGLLSQKLMEVGIGVRQAAEDADSLIIETAVTLCDQYSTVYAIGEDIDLLVILTQIAPSKDNLYFIIPSRGKVEEKIFSTNSFKHPEIKHLIAFIHAFTGCDTTSAFYKQGKAELIKILKNNSNDLIKEAGVFNNPNACKSSVHAAGQKIIMTLYGVNTDDYNFYDSRYLCFTKSTLKNTFNLSTLPPTAEAANEHSLRTYLQVQAWRGQQYKDPRQWGWKQVDDVLLPITSKKESIPQELLQIISCDCDEGNCVSNCTCRKLGLKCTVLCEKCYGQTCSNVAQPEIILSDDEFESDLVRLTKELEDEVDVSCTLIDNVDKNVNIDDSINEDVCEHPRKKSRLM